LFGIEFKDEHTLFLYLSCLFVDLENLRIQSLSSGIRVLLHLLKTLLRRVMENPTMNACTGQEEMTMIVRKRERRNGISQVDP